MPRHILIKLSKIKYKEKILKAARETQQITYKGISIRLTADLSAETLQARRECQNIFKVMKGEECTTKLTLPVKDLIQIQWRNKKLYRQAKAKRVQHYQTNSTTNAKGTSLSGKQQENKRTYTNKPKTIEKMVIGTYISIITYNVNGLNAPTRRHRPAEWIQKQYPYICCLQETHFSPRDTYRLKVMGWKKIFHAKRNQKKAGVAILISDKIDFKIKNVTREKEGHYIMIKEIGRAHV